MPENTDNSERAFQELVRVFEEALRAVPQAQDVEDGARRATPPPTPDHDRNRRAPALALYGRVTNG